MENVAHVNEAFAKGSIEQITEMALKAQADEAGETAGDGKQDVSASSGQTDEQNGEQQAPGAEAKGESDKEINFAKLRTKTSSLEQEVARLAEENKRLASRQYVAELPADHAQKVAELDARLADVGTKFQEGSLTWDDYQGQLKAGNAEREALLAASIKAQISEEMREQQEKEAAEQAAAAEEATQKTWEQTVDGFISSKPDSVDYTTDEAKRKDLNTYVKALGSDPDNNDKSMEWFLQEAHVLVKAKHGIAASAKPTTVAKVPGEETQTSPIRTLSDMPGGLTPAKNDVEQLDSVSGQALTNRFMNMTAAQIDAELAKLA